MHCQLCQSMFHFTYSPTACYILSVTRTKVNCGGPVRFPFYKGKPLMSSYSLVLNHHRFIHNWEMDQRWGESGWKHTGHKCNRWISEERAFVYDIYSIWKNVFWQLKTTEWHTKKPIKGSTVHQIIKNHCSARVYAFLHSSGWRCSFILLCAWLKEKDKKCCLFHLNIFKQFILKLAMAWLK